MEKLTLVKLDNPLRREDKDTFPVDYVPGRTLLDLIRGNYPDGVEIIASVDGVIIPKGRYGLTFPQAGNCILFVPELGFGGGDNKMIIGMVLMIAIAVAAPYAIGAMPVAWGLATAAGSLTMLGSFAAAGMVMMGGLLITALMPHPKPKLPSLDTGFDTTQTYTWSPETTQQQGTCVPRIYGRNKAYGNIIASYIESVNDKQYLNTLICLGIGPVKSITGFKINDQPIGNFSGITVEVRHGDLDQEPISNFNDTPVSSGQLGMKVVEGMPANYTTQGSTFQGLKVEVRFPNGLFYFTDAGVWENYSVDFAVEVQNADVEGSLWVPIATQVVSSEQTENINRWSAGRWMYSNDEAVWYELAVGGINQDSHYEGESYTSDNYEENYFYNFWRWITESKVTIVTDTRGYVTITGNSNQPINRTYKAVGLTQAHYNIRVTNRTPDQTDTRYGDDLYLVSVSEVYEDDFEYPRHALVGIKALATDQLSGSLRFSCIVEGAYVQVWDGEVWSAQSIDNPAWDCYDIFTQPVYDNDLGVLEYRSFGPERTSPGAFKAWADFCDTLVPDGTGGQERRITCNAIYDTETSLWEAALKICNLGRATPVWYGAKLNVVVDKPAQPSQLFNISNMGVNSYEETYLPYEDRASELELDFVNAADDFKRTLFNVFNSNIQNKNNKITLQLFGCTKASEAWRHGTFRLFQNQFALSTARVLVALDALAATVGDVVLLQHDALTPRTTVGGRIVAATATTVTLDREVEISEGKAYAIIIRLANDEILAERGVTDQPGKYTTLTVVTPFATTPEAQDIYSFGEAVKITKPYRILNIAKSLTAGFTLTVITYDENIYTADTGEPIVPPPDTSYERAKVFDLSCSESMERAGDTILNKVTASWRVDKNYRKAKVRVTMDGAVVSEGYTEGTGWQFYGELSREYVINVIACDRWIGVSGAAQTITFTPSLQLLPPANVTGLVSEVTGETLRLSWDANLDIDLSHYIVYISKHNHSDAIRKKVVYNTFADFLLGAGNYKVRVYAVDLLSTRSVQPAEAVVKIPEVRIKSLIASSSPDPGVAGGGTYAGASCYAGASGFRRPAVVGTATSAAITDPASPYLQNYIAGFSASTIAGLDHPVSWFSGMDFSRDSTWEGNTNDFGSIKEGYLSFDYTVTRNAYDHMADWQASVSALAGIRVSDFADDHGVVTVSALVSTDNDVWREATGGYVKARYLKPKICIQSRNPTKEYFVGDVVVTID